MAEIFLIRQFDPPLEMTDVATLARHNADCMDLYQLSWCESFLKEDGRRMLCHFSAPDTESVRMFLARSHSSYEVVWAGTIHEALPDTQVNVVVERRFDQPTSVEEMQRIEDAGAWCLEMHGVTFVQTFFSNDKQYMVCLYQAPDAESVRQAQRKAKMPFTAIWSCQRLTSQTVS